MINAIRIGVIATCLAFPTGAALMWISSAEARLERVQEAAKTPAKKKDDKVAVAAAANEEYCTVELKRVLRRVLRSCGLIRNDSDGTTQRGCQPVDARGMMSGEDFNALFIPMKERGGIVQFDQGKSNLDDDDRKLLDKVFSNQRGASYFFIVSRASPEGSVKRNRKLSRERADALMSHLRERFSDPDLERQVGLLSLGEEFAQLPKSFCDWKRSGKSDTCKPEELNRSAFIAWIDCRL